MIRAQILLPKDLFESARMYAVSRDLSFSELVRKSLTDKVKPKEKESVYVAFKKLAKIVGKKKIMLPSDFATNDKYLYKYP